MSDKIKGLYSKKGNWCPVYAEEWTGEELKVNYSHLKEYYDDGGYYGFSVLNKLNTSKSIKEGDVIFSNYYGDKSTKIKFTTKETFLRHFEPVEAKGQTYTNEKIKKILEGMSNPQ